MNYAAGLAAGFVLIGVVACCTLAGVFIVGTLIGSKVLGGLVGGVVGVVAGFVAVYRIYLVPLREHSLTRDYSKLKPKLDDDD